MGEWTAECQEAFDKMKDLLTSAPILAYPNWELEFKLATDASDFGMGAVLSQATKGMEHVIAYASRMFTPAERNYTVTERECLGVVAYIKYFCPYLLGRHFTVLTDHTALKWLLALKEPTGRLARWVLSV